MHVKVSSQTVKIRSYFLSNDNCYIEDPFSVNTNILKTMRTCFSVAQEVQM